MTASPMFQACVTEPKPIEEPPPTRPSLDICRLAKEADEEADCTLVMPAAWLDALRVQSRPEKPRLSKPSPPRSVEVVELDPEDIVVVDDDAHAARDMRESGVISVDRSSESGANEVEVDVDVDMAFEALKSA